MPTASAKKVLVVDRSAGRARLQAALTGSGYAVVGAADAAEAVGILAAGFRPSAAVIGEVDGGHVQLVEAMREVVSALPAVLLQADREALEPSSDGIETVDRRGASDAIECALIRLLEIDRAGGLSSDANAGDDDMIAASPAMHTIRELIHQVADTDVSVLITGDSGVGKEVVARALHGASDRAGRPFVKVNCAALPDQLLESELFGYERGAFTGADRNKPGKFEAADGGTILLDEIGEISAGTQAKLLQVLQDGCFFRLGGTREVRVDARVIASTNRDLEEEMAEGTFRKDLFYRLNVVRIAVPPLSERREEIPALVVHFVGRYEREYGRRLGELDAAALQVLMRYSWPGNVRELENVVRRMVVLEDVAGVIAGLESSPAQRAGTGIDLDALIGRDGTLPPLKEVSRLAALEVEGELIRRALERTGWNRRQAAKLLNISYKALLYKIRDCEISAA